MVRSGAYCMQRALNSPTKSHELYEMYDYGDAKVRDEMELPDKVNGLLDRENGL